MPGHDESNDGSPTLVESQLMDSLNPESPAALAPAAPILPQPRVWKFWGTALWGFFIFGGMFAGQVAVVAWFVLQQEGPIDLDALVAAVRVVVGRGLTISLSVITGLPAVLAALWIAIRMARAPFADYLALRGTSWLHFLIGAVALGV